MRSAGTYRYIRLEAAVGRISPVSTFTAGIFADHESRIDRGDWSRACDSNDSTEAHDDLDEQHSLGSRE